MDEYVAQLDNLPKCHICDNSTEIGKTSCCNQDMCLWCLFALQNNSCPFCRESMFEIEDVRITFDSAKTHRKDGCDKCPGLESKCRQLKQTIEVWSKTCARLQKQLDIAEAQNASKEFRAGRRRIDCHYQGYTPTTVT